MKKRPATSKKARASTGYQKHLRPAGKRAANKATRRIGKAHNADIWKLEVPTPPKGEFKGYVTTCVHRVAFRYWDFEAELTPELESRLTEAAEERAKECIIDGCHSGDLNCYHVDDDGNEEEIRGWWEIDD